MYIVTGQGQATLGDKSLMSTEISCHFGLLLQVLKKTLCSHILYNFFHDLIHVYSPGRRGGGGGGQVEGLTTPRGPNLDVNRNILSLRSFVASFKNISLKSDFIQFMLYMYEAPGQGQTAPRGQSFDVKRNVLLLHWFVASFKKNVFEVWFSTFFHDLIHVYSPGAGGIQLPGDRVLMSTETSCHFGHLLLDSNLTWQQLLKNPLFYLFPILSLWE